MPWQNKSIARVHFNAIYWISFCVVNNLEYQNLNNLKDLDLIDNLLQ